MSPGVWWGLWLVVVLVLVAGSFAFRESQALRDPQRGDTLTEVVRSWFRIQEKTTAGRLGRVLFLLLTLLAIAFPVWFALHIYVPGFV